MDLQFCFAAEEEKCFNFIYKRIIFPYPTPSMQITVGWDFCLHVASVSRGHVLPAAEMSVWIGQRKLGYMYSHAKHIQRHKGETVKTHNGRNYNVCK